MKKLSTIQKRENLNYVYSMDEKGNGNANHKYLICDYSDPNQDEEVKVYSEIEFQNGARKLNTSIHGVLDSDLLEIVRDRMIGFQSGEFATEYNSKALEHIELALMYLNRRVEDRIERSVLGTNNK